MTDGRTATVRAPTWRDREDLVGLHDHVDDDALRLRFFNVSRTAGRHYVDHVLESGPASVVALVAVVDGELVGLGTAERITPTSAEVAFLVADAERGHGLGTLLLEHLARACAAVGIGQFIADVLPENIRMEEVFRDAGYAVSHHFESGVLRYALSTEESEAVVTATQQRRRLAQEHAAATPRDEGPGATGPLAVGNQCSRS